MKRFLLDTHIWLWTQRNDTGNLSTASLTLIEGWQSEGLACVSPFSAWEVALLQASGRVDLGMPAEKFVEQGTHSGGLILLPLTPRILIESVSLPGTLHRDPVDRILAATARELELTLVTRDEKLLDYARQGHINARKL